MSWEDGIGRRGPLFAGMLLDSKPSPDSGRAQLSEEGLLGSVFLRLGCNGVRFGTKIVRASSRQDAPLFHQAYTGCLVGVWIPPWKMVLCTIQSSFVDHRMMKVFGGTSDK